MKQGQRAQVKKMRNLKKKQTYKQAGHVKPFDFNEWAGFLRARYYLMYHDKYDQKTFEVASFFFDDLLAMIVQQHFTQFTSNERAAVNLNEAMQATLVNSEDRDWRYFILLVPVLFDMQKLLVKESQVNTYFIASAPKFDINFWRMIVRTVLAVNFFKWQGKDVAEMMKTSNAIDELQYKFLSQNDEDDDFDLQTIGETFRGLAPVVATTDDVKQDVEVMVLSQDLVDAELVYAQRRLEDFKAAAIKDVVSDNVLHLLYAYHEGMAKIYGRTHKTWDAESLKQFTKQELFDYWQPQWQDLDGIGGELRAYLKFLSQKKAINGLGKLLKGIEGLDHYIDVMAINTLLVQLTPKELETLN